MSTGDMTAKEYERSRERIVHRTTEKLREWVNGEEYEQKHNYENGIDVSRTNSPYVPHPLTHAEWMHVLLTVATTLNEYEIWEERRQEVEER